MAGYLKRIEQPEDLKRLGWQELQELAGELREEIIRVVAANGGHLAPNLGVVELTLALHRVFASPRDKIIWDVGHQCYAHKLITGRRELFPTLRRLGGLSGFPKPEESPHDAFATGHSSTAVSAALGMAIARDLAGEDYHVVAVVGDGAMTGGMAFEALNHAGHLKTRLIVVLNDNEMSIAPNVGALAAYLSRLRTDPKYYRGKEEIEQFLRRVPSIGPAVLKAAERLKDSLKYLVVPGMLFEELGFTYLGPIDGHNIREMVEVFTKARTLPEPVLVHVLTRKGKGYEPAEKDCDKFHGIGPFDIKTGQPQGRSTVPTYTEVFGRTVIKLAETERRLVAITAAMPSGTGLKPFAGRFPARFFDVGIAEQHAVTLAAGMARAGLKPVVAIYSTFLQRAYDQIVHDVCLQCLPVIFAIDRAGLVGEDGPTHHGVLDIAYLRSIPNMIIMAPRNENELQHMLYTALHCNQPAAVRYPRSRGEGVPLDGELRFLTPGRAEVLREGRDIVLLAVGTMVTVAEEVADELARDGITAAVINARFIKPLDRGTILHYARQTGRVVTIEEHALAGGFGSAVLELLQEAGLEGIKVIRFGIPDRFIEHGKREELLELCGLTADKIVSMLRQELFARRRRFKGGLSAVRKVE